MKTRLQEHFGNRIVQIEINGKPNVITFRTTARVVLQDYYSKHQQKQTTAEEKIKLVQAAAKLIKEDIKAIETSNEIYPLCDDLQSQEAGIKYLPDTLRVLLEELFVGKKAEIKVACNDASYSTPGITNTIAVWIGCAAIPSLCITILNRLPLSSWVLLFLPRSSAV